MIIFHLASFSFGLALGTMSGMLGMFVIVCLRGMIQ